MDTEELRLFVVGAPDEPRLRSPDYQKQLREFTQFLKSEGLDFSSHVELHEVVGAGAVYLGDFGIKLAAIIGPALGTVLGAWLHAKYGRKVRVKIGDIELEAQTIEQVQELVKVVEDYQRKHLPSPQQEYELVEALVKLGPYTNYLEAAIGVIRNHLGCSQSEALAFLRGLQERSLIESQPKTIVSGLLSSSDPLPQPRCIWLRVEADRH